MPKTAKKPKKQSGAEKIDLLLTAHRGTNAKLFPRILRLHVPEGATIADVTYGTGIFWREVDLSKYKLLATDLTTGVDCRHLPYEDGSLECVVLDPPYMEGLLRRNKS